MSRQTFHSEETRMTSTQTLNIKSRQNRKEKKRNKTIVPIEVTVCTEIQLSHHYIYNYILEEQTDCTIC